MGRQRWTYLLCAGLAGVLGDPAAADEPQCFARTDQGWVLLASATPPPELAGREIRCTRGALSVPTGQTLARPTEIALGGSVRRIEINTPLGKVLARWARSAEGLFGTNPERAIIDAMTTVSKALKRGGLPPELSRLNQSWDIVIMDENLPEHQIPDYLVNRCHPAWMVKSASIYVVAQRVANGCSGYREAGRESPDVELARTLIHEIGHGIEYSFLNGKTPPPDPVRSEGFATWWETYAARSSSMVSADKLRHRYKTLAGLARRDSQDQASFAYTEEEYAKAALYFMAVEEARGISAISEVYQYLSEGSTIQESVQRALGWDATRLDKMIERSFERD